MVETFRFRVQIEWRRGSKHLRRALDEMRRQVVQEIGREMRDNAPHPSLAAAVTVQRSTITVDHPAALVFEYGMEPGTFPPLEPIRAWASKVGQVPKDAFAVARHLFRTGIEVQPWVWGAVEAGLARATEGKARVWDGGG